MSPLSGHDAQIVRRHLVDRLQRQPVRRHALGHVFQVAHAPLRVPGLQRRVEGFVAGRGMNPVPPKGAVQEQHAAGGNDLGRAGEQRLGRRWRGDVDHVEADDGIHLGHRPDRVMDIERQRRADIRQLRRLRPSRDRRQAAGIPLRRLPAQMRHRLREMHDMLPRTAADLQHGALGGQEAQQELGDGAFVPFSRGAG